MVYAIDAETTVRAVSFISSRGFDKLERVFFGSNFRGMCLNDNDVFAIINDTGKLKL
jgi:hypothetical protein